MIPVLYDKYEAEFISNGIGQMADCLSCEATEEVNGIYEIIFTYPVTGPLFERLINYGGVVMTAHDHTGDLQLFDIYKYEAPINGVCTFYACHVSYRLNNVVMNNTYSTTQQIPQTPAEVFESWENGDGLLYGPLAAFSFVDETGYEAEEILFQPQAPYTIRKALLNREEGTEFYTNSGTGGSVIQLWPGEYIFDNFTVTMKKKRGENRGVELRYGKNITDAKRTRDAGEIISAVIPLYKSGNSWRAYPIVQSPYTEVNIAQWISGTSMTLNGETAYFHAADIRAVPLDLSDQFNAVPTEAKARAAALNYMSKNSSWRAQDSVEVTVADRYNEIEYADKKGLCDFRCGDYVSIYFPELGIAESGIGIVSCTFDVLAEKFTKLELGSIRPSLAKVIIDSMGG